MPGSTAAPDLLAGHEHLRLEVVEAARVGLPEHLCARARELSMNAGGPLARALNAAEEDRRQLQEQLERAKAEGDVIAQRRAEVRLRAAQAS